MSETILAAWITGGLQAASAITAIVAAWITLHSWRRHALGARQIELAEACLGAVWDLDTKIVAARLLVAPPDLKQLTSDAKYYNRWFKRHKQAFDALENCTVATEAFKKTFMLSEWYTGECPRVRSLNNPSGLKGFSQTIPDEYAEIVGLLFMRLIEIVPTPGQDMTEQEKKSFLESADLFFGFVTDYERDIYSARLLEARLTLERHLRSVLRRRGVVERLSDRLGDWVHDRHRRKITPTKVSKYRDVASQLGSSSPSTAANDPTPAP